MKVLLIQPPVRDFYFTSKRSIPYGLISIASVLQKHCFDVELIDSLSTTKSKVIPLPDEMLYTNELYGRSDLSPFGLFHKYKYFGYSQEHIGNLIVKSNADVIGISSLFSAYSNEVDEIARLAKKKLINCIVVVGGHHPTAMPFDSMTESSIDYAIRGEGEVVLPELLYAIKRDEPVKNIKGLVYRDAFGNTIINEPALMEKPDEFPLPATKLLNHKFYSRKNGASMVITASRGCPMMCTYCCVASSFSKFRKRSVDIVFKEIERSVNTHGVRFIDFEDENLTLSRDWFFELMQRVQNAFPDLELEFRAMNGLLPPTLDDEMISMMKDVGFKTINLSLCTTSVGQLKRFKRPDVRIALEKVIASARKKDMEAVCYLIVGAPGQDALESVDDLLYLNNLDVVAGVSVFYPAPGSIEFERSKEMGLVPDKNSLLRSSVIPVCDTTSRIDSVTLLRLGRILNYMKLLRIKGICYKPEKFNNTDIESANKELIGTRLLNAFLYDGLIRGIDAEGVVYEHKISMSLSQRFIKGLNLNNS